MKSRMRFSRAVTTFLIFICLCAEGKSKNFREVWSSFQDGEYLVENIRKRDAEDAFVANIGVTYDTSTEIELTTDAGLMSTNTVSEGATYTQGSTEVTTTTSSSPTTQPPLQGSWDNSYYGWNLSFALAAPFNNTSNNSTMKMNIIDTLESCFNDSANRYFGYSHIDDNLKFEPYNVSTLRLYRDASDNTTVVRYTAWYYAQTIVEQGNTTAVARYINDVVMLKLKNSSIFGYDIIDKYIDNVTSTEIWTEEEKIEKDALMFCQTAAVDCPQFYDCYNNAENKAAPCYPVCYQNITIGSVCCWEYTQSSTTVNYCQQSHEECYPKLDDSGFECSCVLGYYYLSGECRTVWVSFTVLAVMVIVVCVLVSIGVWVCIQKRHNASRLGPATGGNKNQAYGNDIDDETPRNNYDNEPPPTSFNSNEKYSDNFSDDKSQTALKSYETTHKDVGYNSDAPVSSSVDDGSDSHIPIELQQSPAYTGFHANLAVVDSTTNYFQNRPKINVKIDTVL